MEKLISLYDYAQENDVGVYFPYIGHFKSVIIKDIKDVDILLDMKAISNEAEETECLAHELGHFATGSYYNFDSTAETRSRLEYRANRWTVHKMLPFNELKDALLSDITEIWELAEYFNYTEDFVRKAIEIYRRQGLLID